MPRKSRSAREVALARVRAAVDAAAAKSACPLVHLTVGSAPDTCVRCGRPMFWMPPPPPPPTAPDPLLLDDEEDI